MSTAANGPRKVSVVGDALRRIKFIAERRIHGIEAPVEPHFDSVETTEWFSDELANARCYLEYGSGGSTYLAAKLGVRFATVESDRGFLEAVKAQIARDGYLRSGQVFHHADIGPTGRWGRPLGRVSDARIEKFCRYSDTPPGFDVAPDLVLVDGRFRVACVLKAMSKYPAATIVLDDYLERPQYSLLEDYVRPRMVGRMAVLESWDTSGLGEAIEATQALPA